MSIVKLYEQITMKETLIEEIKAEIKTIKAQIKALRTPKKPKAKTYIEHLPTLRTVSEACAEAFCLQPDEMKNEHRHSHLVSARAVYAHICLQKGIPITYIAKYIHRHHTSIFLVAKDFQSRYNNYLEHQAAMHQVLTQFLP
jgi:chromosomal replication initiation ATPase DnaA